MTDKHIETLIASMQPENMRLGLTLGATLHSNRSLRSFLTKYVLSGKYVDRAFLYDKVFKLTINYWLKKMVFIALREVKHILDEWPYSIIAANILSPKAQLIHRHITLELTLKERIKSLKEWESCSF